MVNYNALKPEIFHEQWFPKTVSVSNIILSMFRSLLLFIFKWVHDITCTTMMLLWTSNKYMILVKWMNWWINPTLSYFILNWYATVYMLFSYTHKSACSITSYYWSRCVTILFYYSHITCLEIAYVIICLDLVIGFHS